MLDKHAKNLRGFYHYCPAVATIVTASKDQEKDAMAAAWHSPISFSPPLYGVAISPKRHTYELISESEEFGVNFVPFELARLVAQVGGCSGRDVDKFERFQIREVDPVRTSVPIIRDAYAAYECKLFSRNTYGDHEWFVGEIVVTHIDSSAFDAKDVLSLETPPTLYMGRDFYLKLGSFDIIRLDRAKLSAVKE